LSGQDRDCGPSSAKDTPLGDNDRTRRFEAMALPHLDAAYNLARWLTRADQDARDVVQDSYLRAFQFFDGFKGGDGRAWLLTIVRNTAFNWLKRDRKGAIETVFDETLHGGAALSAIGPAPPANPETLLLQRADSEAIDRAIAGLPLPFREAIVLRELEELSYAEIAEIAGVPIGTVMSRLARARELLRRALTDASHKERRHGG
jgi:RNA polymerase sigma-70 factor (ECF subfamily)